MKPEIIQDIVNDMETNRKWKQFLDRFNVDAKDKGFFQGATFELTAFCTLKCPMCFVRIDKQTADVLGGRLRTAQEWIDMARQFRDQGGLFLLLTGGEAMMRPDFPEIYEEISKMGLLVSLFTNGTTVDDKMLELLRRRPPAMMGLTLYGASEETYRKFSDRDGNFQRALDGLDRLLTIPNLALDVRFVVCSENYKDTKAVCELVAKRNKLVNFDYGSCAPVRGACANTRKLRLNKAQEAEVNEILSEFTAPIQAELERRNNLAKDKKENVEVDLMAKESSNIYAPKKIGLNCLGGKNNVYIAWDGRMYPCDMSEFPYAFPFEQGFKSAAFDIREGVDHLVMPDKCMTCVNIEKHCGCIPKALNEMRDCARHGEKCDYVHI